VDRTTKVLLVGQAGIEPATEGLRGIEHLAV
jgi:hypothetical protein